jgi:L-methionine (R)-S-oxide reductase
MDTNREQELESWLTRFLGEVQAVAGTVHLHENGGLRLGAAVNIHPPVCEAVQTCNLKEDATGAVKPGARAVDAKAAVALPVRDRHGAIVAVVGAAFADDREIAHDELARLQRASASLVGV